MKKIIINNKAVIHAYGNLNTKNCKPVICVDTGATYTSATDAAEAAGVTISCMSCHLTGKTKTVKGKRYCYMSNAPENLDSIVTRLREASAMESDAQKWRAYQAEQEAIRKAEAKRLDDERKAKERREAAIAKAEAKVAKCAADCSKYETKWNESMNALDEANKELEALLGEEAS